MRLKKLGILIMAGTLTCMAPMPVMASSTTDVIDEILENDEINSIISDPDKAVDIIMYVKDAIAQQDISDETISNVIDEAADTYGISLSDSDKDTLLNLAKKIKDMDINEEELRSQVTAVYDKLEELGIGKEQVKGILQTAIDFVKSIF